MWRPNPTRSRRYSPPALASPRSATTPCTRSRCAARSGSTRCDAATPTPRPTDWSTCSGHATLGHDPAHVPVAAHRRHGARLQRRHPGRPAAASAPTTSRSHRPSICTPCATGTVPLQFLFSGTVFAQGTRGFSVQQVPWDREDRYDMPVSVWRDLIEQHFPNTGWLRLDRDTIDALADVPVRARAVVASTRRSPRCFRPAQAEDLR